MAAGSLGLENVGALGPLTNTHNPVPDVTVLADNAVLVPPQTTWSGPTVTGLGAADILNFTSAELDGHAPLDIVHRKVYEKLGDKNVTEEVGLEGLVIITGPGPVNRVHNPVPIRGVLPFNVTELTPQVLTTLWEALACVAGAEAVIITVSLLLAHPGVDKLHSNK